MISNTATPYYYGLFRDAVLAGKIPVNKEISLQMNRIDQKIANPNFYYDSNAIQGAIEFANNELTLTDGSDMNLLDSFKLWAEDAFAWVYFKPVTIYVPAKGNIPAHYIRKNKKMRLTTKQIIVLGRGGAKSMYDYWIQAYELIINPKTTQQATTAPTMSQADEVLAPFRTAISRSRGPVFKFMTQGSIHNTTGSIANRPILCSTKKGIENTLTNSLLKIRPMSKDKFQGGRETVVTIDEWLSGDTREDVMGAAEQSASKNDGEYLIIGTSSEGTVRNGPGDDIKMEMMQILRGEYYAPNVSIFWYKLDDISEVANPEMWIKAQPNLGKTVSFETYARDVERMEKVPSARNDILAKRFGIPSEGYTFFFSYEQTLVHPYRSCDNMLCAMGADLSQGDDFCSFSFLFPMTNGCFAVKTLSFVSAIHLGHLTDTLRAKYDAFQKEGSLIVMPGVNLDIKAVYDELMAFINKHRYQVVCFGYDPYNAEDYFVPRWNGEHGSFYTLTVRQGARTESVPLGEIHNLAEQRMLLFDEQIMQFAMGNCITIENNNGGRMLYKKRQERKIDPVAATLDAYIAYKAWPDNFI